MVKAEGQTKVYIDGAGWLGDALLSIPALRLLRGLLPRGEITLLCEPWLSELYLLLPEIDRLIEVSGGSKGLKRCLSLAQRLRVERFDMALFFRNSFWPAAAAFLAGIPERIGYAANFRSPLLTKSLKRKLSPNREHQSRSFLALVSRISPGGELKTPSHLINLGREQKERAGAWLAAKGVSPGDLLVGVHPGASYGSAKRWPAAGFARLAGEMTRRIGAKVVLFGSKREEALTSAVKSQAGAEMIDAGGQLGLAVLASVMASCRVLVCNDSGPMHLASAVGTPVVAIFGSTDPAFTGPLGPGEVISAKANCAPCFRRNCPTDLRCMSLVTPEMVLESVKRIAGSADGSIGGSAFSARNVRRV